MNKPIQFGQVRQFVKGYLTAEVVRRFLWREWILGVVVFATLTGILVANLVPAQINLTLGQVSKRDIEANRTVVDTVGTEKLQEDAVQRAIEALAQDPTSYVISPSVATESKEAAASVLFKIRAVRDIADEKSGAVDNLQKDIAQNEGVILTTEALRMGLAATDEALDAVAETVKSAVGVVLSTKRIDDDSLESARGYGDQLVTKARTPGRSSLLASELVRGLIRPNLSLDPARLQDAQAGAIRSIEPVRILKGQTIIRKGDVITSDHLRILRALGMQRARVSYLNVLGVTLFSLMVVVILGVYLKQFNPEILANEALLSLLGLIVIAIAFTAKILSTLSWAGAGFVIPIAFGTMLVAILLDSRLAIVVAVALALLVGVVTGHDFRFVLVALVGGIAGVFSVSKVSQRGDLMRAGLIVGAVNFSVIVALGFFSGDLGEIRASYLGLVNGIVSSIFAIGSLAYLELLFGITSAIRLLELSNPNHPLLKQLLVEAPGTYHHSIMVGNLAEAAAESVAGDPLLARVGAYYHDIGKVKRPYFFAENQFAADNPHDKIAPGLSTLIITQHVKDGVEMAKEKRLPEVVVDFIRQHHGTDLVRYFFHRAMENDRANPQERDFRYGGPKPQTKETAIVMLADSVEAAVRGIQKPTPGRIEGLVRKMIKDRLTDGQLDECNLTLKDLDVIANSFVRVLSGMFHTRVEYPDKLLKEIENRKG